MPETVILTEGGLGARRGRRGKRSFFSRKRGTLLDVRVARKIKSPKIVRRAFGKRTVRRLRPVYYRTNGAIHRTPFARLPISSIGGETDMLSKGLPSGIMKQAWRGSSSRGQAMRKAWSMVRGRRGRSIGLLSDLDARRGRRRGYRRHRGLLEARAGILPAGLLPARVSLMDMVGAGTGLITVLYLPKILPIPATFKVGIPKILVSLGLAVIGSFAISKLLKKAELGKSFFIGAMGGTIAIALDQFVLGGAVGLADFAGVYSPEMIRRGGQGGQTVSELSAVYGKSELGEEDEEEVI